MAITKVSAALVDLDGGVVINESSADADFRVESNGNTHMLFVDGGNDCVSIGASTNLTGALNITHGNEFGLVTSGSFNFQAKFESTDAEAGIVIEDSNSGTDYNRIGVITNDMAFTTNNSEKMRILSSGNVGIGITSPATKLQLLHAGECKITLGYSTTQYAQLGRDSSGNYELACYENGANLKFGTSTSNNATTERMRIESTGDVRFNIANAALTAGEVHTMTNAGRGNNLALYTTGGNTLFSIDMWNHTGGTCKQVQFRSGGNGTVVGSITSTGDNATQYNTSSDYRLKENVDYTWDATTRLKQLKPARFNFISDADNTVDGFLAHEVSSIVPESITGTKDASETKTNCVLMAGGSVFADGVTEAEWTQGKTDGTYESNTTWVASKTEAVYQAIDQSKLVPLLVKTIQELEARITTLEG